MNSREQKHYFLQTGYYTSFALALLGGLATAAFSLYAIKTSLTQDTVELQWAGVLVPIFLVGIPSFALGALNFKFEGILKQLQAQGLFLGSSKKVLKVLMIFVCISVGVTFAISIFRLDVLPSIHK